MSTIQAAFSVAAKHSLRFKDTERARSGTRTEPTHVQRKAASRSIQLPVFLMVVSAITVGMIVNVAQQALVSQGSYQIENIRKDIQAQQQICDKLLAQKAKLESPQRIENVAMNQLSMIKTSKISYLKILNEEGSSGVKAPRKVAVNSANSAMTR